MQDQSAALEGAAEADAAFGADLYRLLTQDATETVFSPASVACALQMALCGARGDTAAELARALHLDGPGSASADAAGAAAQGLRLLTALLGEVAARGYVTFRAPNTMWVQSGLALLPEFTAPLRDAAAVTDEGDLLARLRVPGGRCVCPVRIRQALGTRARGVRNEQLGIAEHAGHEHQLRSVGRPGRRRICALEARPGD